MADLFTKAFFPLSRSMVRLRAVDARYNANSLNSLILRDGFLVSAKHNDSRTGAKLAYRG